MARNKIILILAGALLLILGNFRQVFALRNVTDGDPQLAGNITREKVLKQQILAEKQSKIMSGVRTPTMKPAPLSYPMPTREELAASRTAKAVIPLSNTVAPSPDKATIMQDQQAIQSREKAFQQEQEKSAWVYWLPGALLVFLMIGGLIFLTKKNRSEDEQGSAIIIALIVMLMIFVTGVTLVYLTQNESNKTIKSSADNSALYVADGGVEKALWEVNRAVGYSGESDTALGNGKFTVAVSTPAGQPNRRDIISVGTVGKYHKKIKATCERMNGNIAVDSALCCGNNVSIGGNAQVSGATTTGVLVPVGNNVNTFGSGGVNGNPPTGNAPFPVFDDVFSMSQAQMEGLASTHYTNPGNNAPADGITWANGDYKVSSHGWHGGGILIVTGDFEMTGGEFDGVIFVMGNFRMAGNAHIKGSILSQSSAGAADILGTADIDYDIAAITAAGNLYPFKIIAWQEVKN